MMATSYFQNTWAVTVVLGALVFVFAEAWLRRRLHLCVVLRGLWILLLGWTIGELVFVQSTKWSQPEAIKIFIDRSDSVALLSERKSRTNEFLKELETWVNDRKLPAHVYSFGDQLIEESFSIHWGALKTLLQPTEEGTLQQEGVNILVSDGLWTDHAELKGTTFSVSIGEQDEKDVWIENISPVFTAFLKNRLKIPVTLSHRGFDGKKIKVSLWRSSEKIDEKEVRFEQQEASTEFTYFPERMGEQIFVVKVEPVDGELTVLNNERPIKIRTVRDKIRLLHIGGKPSLDLKAWRLFLTRQPDVDLVSFYILRSTNDDPEAKNSELSLIPFPYEDLFTTELEKFDVVILQNFDFNLYFPPYYLSNLARFIREGGALLMIGGDQSFHRYQGSPLESLFPFKFDGVGNLEEKVSSVEWEGHHPVLDGVESAFQIPKWTARHTVSKEQHSTSLVNFKTGAPFISLREVDRGRVAAINSDELWKLQMQPTTEAPAFGKFARRILQYLTFDPEVNPKGLVSGPWRVGKEVQLSLASHEKTNWKIRSMAFRELEVSFRNESEIRFEVPFPGVFEVKVDALHETQVFQTEEQPWTSEWKRVLSDEKPLQKMAEVFSGKYFSFDERRKIFNQPLSGKQMISAQVSSWTRNASGWSWLILLLTISVMCFDFFLRKRIHWDA